MNTRSTSPARSWSTALSTALRFAACFCSLLALPAAAAPVHGKVVYPDDVKGTGRYPTYWRIPNGVLPVTPDPRAESVVVLYPQGTVTGAQVAAAETAEQKGPARFDMKLSGLKLSPTLLVVPVGATVTLHNEDRQPHPLALICTPQGGMADRQNVAPGQSVSLTFDKQMDCGLHSTELMHLTGAVLVVDRGFYGKLDGNGAFQFEAPEGHYLAKLFYRGAFIANQTIDVLASGLDLSFKTAAAQDPPLAGELRQGGKPSHKKAVRSEQDATRPESRQDGKAPARPKGKTEAKGGAEPESRQEAGSGTRPAAATDGKGEGKPDTKGEGKPDTKGDTRTDAKADKGEAR